MPSTKKLTAPERDALLKTLHARFDEQMQRHKTIKWPAVEARLTGSPAKLWTLHQMEETGGEPDVVGKDPKSGEFLFYDCSPESPKGRRSLCYDRKALDARKEHKPKGSAVDMASDMGLALLSESEYRALQELGEFDLKTSSWLLTPADVRTRGGAIFGDRRYDTVWTYHNGAESYYAARGFRGVLRV